MVVLVLGCGFGGDRGWFWGDGDRRDPGDLGDGAIGLDRVGMKIVMESVDLGLPA